MILTQNVSPKVQEWQSYGKFRKVTLNPHFSEKVERGDQGKFFKNRPKSSPCLKNPKALWRKLNYTLIKINFKCKDWRIFWRKKRLKSVRMGKLWQFSQGHPKAAFSEKVQRGDEDKFFNVPQKNSPHLKGPTALWRKWHYPLISMQLKCKDWRKLWRKKKLQKCPKGHVKAIFERSPKSRVF